MYKEDVELAPCPFCKKDDKLVAGHVEAMKFAVVCERCRCRGPQWSYWSVTGDDGCIMPEYEEEIGEFEDVSPMLCALDAYLLDRAIDDWNRDRL